MQPRTHDATASSTLTAGAEAQGTALSRVVWGALLLVSGAVLVTAAMLTPDPAGHGTHTQLGLPPCGFLLVTGIPCPGCGLTTSFAHMIRLEVVSAVRANAFGVPLFLVTAACAVVSALGLWRGAAVLPTLDRLHFEKVAVGLAVAGVITWAVRLGALWMAAS